MKIRSLHEAGDLKNKKVLLRVDFNVPLNETNEVADNSRIKAALPTINYLKEQGAKIIILTHLGRPAGAVVPKFSTKVLTEALEKLLNFKVIHLDNIPSPAELEKALAESSVVMLENVRFYLGEEKNDLDFAKQLAVLGEIYVNDAFSVSHRAHASVEALARLLPAYAGFQLAKEVENLSKVLESPARPKVAIIGGAKLDTKVKVIKNLLKTAEAVLVGGAIANNFFKAKGLEVGLSKVDDKELATAKELLTEKKLIIPVDVVVAPDFTVQAAAEVKLIDEVGPADIILDLGLEAVKQYAEIIKSAKLVVWNGPLGYFEVAKYKQASGDIAQAIVASGAYSVAGGGETVQLINELGLADKFNFVSMSGGAMLEFLEGKMLPGIKPLIEQNG
ncbi:MAG: phosphoglycerate kinase [Candidatus Komeilibacteria bacterium]|nr:phosphoglycerate kinase [Candidatus Komeilibacteria bacterium]